MKRSNLVWVSSVLAALLGGCRWDGNSILGNSPEERLDQGNQIVDAYNVCREQRVNADKVENAAGCATPTASDITEFSAVSTDKVKIVLLKMWDGTFPKLTRLRFHARNRVPGYNREVPCKLVPGIASERAYECQFPEVEYSTEHLFVDLDLVHDTCAARASFKAGYFFPVCEESSSYHEVDTVWWGERRLPSLQEPTKPKNP